VHLRCLDLVMKFFTCQNFVLFVVEYGPTFGVICVISARWPNSIYVTEGSYSTVFMYEVVGEYNGKPRMWWEGEYILQFQAMCNCYMAKYSFCGFKQCVNGTWQMISWFQEMYEYYIAKYSVVSNSTFGSVLLFQSICKCYMIEVFCDFQQYMGTTGRSLRQSQYWKQ